LAGALVLLGGNEIKDTALAAALTAHLVNYFFTGLIGFYALSKEGETLKSIYRQIRKKQEKETDSPAP
jgi:hypothetical protein